MTGTPPRRPIEIPQSHIRRAGDALARSLQADFNDVYLLASKMLKAAIRHEVDVAELTIKSKQMPQDESPTTSDITP